MYLHYIYFHRVKVVTLLFLILIAPIVVHAGEDATLRRHIIVAVDNAGTKSWVFSPEAARAVHNALFQSYPSVQVEDTLFRVNDYISLVKFDAKYTDNILDGYYVKPILDELSCMQERTESIRSISSFLSIWSSARNNNPPSSVSCYSILSVAKPYILKGVSLLASQARDKDVKVNRTFLIMITDNHYNANDFYAEISSWVKSGGYNFYRNRVSEDSLSAFCRRVEHDYYIHHIITDTIGSRKFLEVYEYQPLQQHFTLPSVLSYPVNVKAHRIWGNKYQIPFSVGTQRNDHFKIDRVIVSIKNRDGKLGYETNLNNVTTEERMTITFERSAKKEYNKIELKAWLTINDGFYGFTQMSPTEQSPDFLGRKGLTTEVEIEYEKDAHILGVLPMPDFLWWFYHNDQQKGALAMSFFLVMLLLVGIVLFVWRSQHYHPKPTQLKLRQIR